MNSITIVSEAFNKGDIIPVEYTCDGRNRSPQLSWTGIPGKTASIVLIMYDPDASTRPFTHWTIYNISPNIRGLPKWLPNSPKLTNWPFGDVAYQALNDFGDVGYKGPCPPPGKPHRYIFKVYALGTILDVPPGTSNEYIRKHMEGDILATGELMGIYGR